MPTVVEKYAVAQMVIILIVVVEHAKVAILLARPVMAPRISIACHAHQNLGLTQQMVARKIVSRIKFGCTLTTVRIAIRSVTAVKM